MQLSDMGSAAREVLIQEAIGHAPPPTLIQEAMPPPQTLIQEAIGHAPPPNPDTGDQAILYYITVPRQ